MGSTIRYAQTFNKQYKIKFQESRTKDITRGMGKKNILDTRSNSKYERYDRVGKMIIRFKDIMGMINTIAQFETG